SDIVQLSTNVTPNPQQTTSPYGENNGFNCPESIVDSAVTIVNENGSLRQGPLTSGALPVDGAVDEGGFQIAVVPAAPGQVALIYAANVTDNVINGQCNPVDNHPKMEGSEPIAVAWDGKDIVAQTRNPAGLMLSSGKNIPFPVKVREDRGFSLFHAQAG